MAPVEAADDPLTALQARFRDAVDGPATENALHYGCPLGNLVQEVSSLDEELRARVDQVLRGWIESLRRALRSIKKSAFAATAHKVAATVKWRPRFNSNLAARWPISHRM